MKAGYQVPALDLDYTLELFPILTFPAQMPRF